MDKKEELVQYLKTLRKELSEDAFLTMILDRLDKGPSKEERTILEAWLMVCAVYDPDRVARYWEPLLQSEHPFQREVAALKLSILARLKPDALAYRLLTEYLGQKPTGDKIEGIMKERFLRLYPDNKEDK